MLMMISLKSQSKDIQALYQIGSVAANLDLKDTWKHASETK